MNRKFNTVCTKANITPLEAVNHFPIYYVNSITGNFETAYIYIYMFFVVRAYAYIV